MHWQSRTRSLVTIDALDHLLDGGILLGAVTLILVHLIDARTLVTRLPAYEFIEFDIDKVRVLVTPPEGGELK